MDLPITSAEQIAFTEALYHQLGFNDEPEKFRAILTAIANYEGLRNSQIESLKAQAADLHARIALPPFYMTISLDIGK